MLTVTARSVEGENVRVEVAQFPDQCPICHFAIEPKFGELAHVTAGFDASLELVFQCPRLRCQRLFISRYRKSRLPGTYHFDLEASVPFEPFEVNFSETLKSISPMFCNIANEAQNAEHKGWKLIAGPGYRKALEFLIKDYLCRSRPDDANKIKSAQLGLCIANYVDDSRIKATAARAAWLGNDETHYVRKWEDKDLEDLKKLIQLTVHWIEMQELTEGIISDMPEGKK
jgi:hypothetical protein